MTTDDLVRAAARNNAAWCATMAGAHGISGRTRRQAWASPVRTPPLYPDAVTLVPGADAAALVDRIDTRSPGASVKDSFADLDLSAATPQGAAFEVAFDASWIHRPPASAPGAPMPGVEWATVTDAAALRTWAGAWDQGGGRAWVFRPELLGDPSTTVLAGRTGAGAVVAGAVATRTDGVVGVSNVFAVPGTPGSVWHGVLGAVGHLFPGVPVVGYECGDDLEAALRHGFEVVGPLRVWVAASPTG
ncbi:hypothetical protein [Isoptericola sp. NPDC057653]|uniref:hypothetical protein n=1 Tax=Isoptericola sp. NPDC057653 TaxID=3346195 RepID=UPI0036D1B221